MAAPIPPIIYFDKRIEELTALAPGHPVYLLTYETGEQFILKGEKEIGGGRSVHEGRKAMNFGYDIAKKVAHGAQSRTLDNIESRNIRQLFGRTDLDQASRDDLKNAYDEGQQWVLMQFVSGLTDFKAITGYGGGKLMDSDKTPGAARGAQMLLIELKSKDNLERLGRLAAVDAFLHNDDRFNFSSDERLQNAGNLFFRKKQDGTLSIRGLDPVDPNSSWARFDTDMATAKNDAAGNDWYGLKLATPAGIDELADRVMNSLNFLLGNMMDRRGTGAFSSYKLGKKQRKHIVKGIKTGTQEIKTLSKSRLSGNGGRLVPAGLKERTDALGWTGKPKGIGAFLKSIGRR